MRDGLPDNEREQFDAPRRYGIEERHRTLLEINNAVITNLAQGALLHATVEALKRVLPFTRAALTIHDPAEDVQRILALEGIYSDYFIVGLALSKDSHPNWVFEHQRPLLRRDLEQ